MSVKKRFWTRGQRKVDVQEPRIPRLCSQMHFLMFIFLIIIEDYNRKFGKYIKVERKGGKVSNQIIQSNNFYEYPGVFSSPFFVCSYNLSVGNYSITLLISLNDIFLHICALFIDAGSF